MRKSKSAFTMIELVFVIVVIGILASVAIPRLAATRDDAEISKARVLVASIRNALSMERQKRILRGDFDKISAVGDTTDVFGNFYSGTTKTNVAVLEYSIKSEPNTRNRWSFSNDEYIFKSTLGDTKFKVDSNGKFVCVDESSDDCKKLTN